MHSNIDWARLENQLRQMENLRIRCGIEPVGSPYAEDRGYFCGTCGSTDIQSTAPSPTISFYDPTCHTLGGETGTSTASNKISGDK